MKFINQSAEIVKQPEGIQGIFDIIAECAATCYKSTPKTGVSAQEFVNTLTAKGHTAMLEFGTLYYKIPVDDLKTDDELKQWFTQWYGSPYIDYDCDGKFIYGTTNLRYAVESKMWAPNMNKYVVDKEDLHPERICLRIITSIGIARELTRHRRFSFAQESTRFCNYSGKKFDCGLTFITPEKEDWGGCTDAYVDYINILTDAEHCYMRAIQQGIGPQIARDVLPLSLKTEICMCGFKEDWDHFFDLRLKGTTGTPHPDMKALAQIIYDKLN